MVFREDLFKVFRKLRALFPGAGVFLLAHSFILNGQQKMASDNSIASIQSLIRSHQYDQALLASQSAVNAAPSDFRIRVLEGLILSIQGKDSEALSAFD